MQGVLARYGPNSSQLCFITKPSTPAPSTATAVASITTAVASIATSDANQPGRHLICIGGLSDGLLYASYVPPLAQALNEMGWTLVQAQLRSCYEGFGLASLDADAADLKLLLDWLCSSEGSAGVALLGHSTGCQDIVRFLQGTPTLSPWPLLGSILQAAASDREYMKTLPNLEPVVVKARQMQAEGRGEEVVARISLSSGGVTPTGNAITARRLLALYERGGDDDFFSSDLSDKELKGLLSPVGRWPCMVVAGTADEYVDPKINVPTARRLVQAINTGNVQLAELLVVEGGNHSLDGHEADFAASVAQFLASLPEKGVIGSSGGVQ